MKFAKIEFLQILLCVDHQGMEQVAKPPFVK